jgi:hypothetical protein
MVLDAYDGELPDDVAAMMASVSGDELARMASLIRKNVQVSRARGVGRYFDASDGLKKPCPLGLLRHQSGAPLWYVSTDASTT